MEPRKPTHLFAPIGSVALALWLIASVFAWPHHGAEGLNALVTGLLVLSIAWPSVWAPGMRWATPFLAAWLVTAAISFSHLSQRSLWNDLLVGIALFVLALVPSQPRPWREHRARG